MYEAVSERDPMLSPGGGKGGAAAVRSLRLQPPAPKCNDAFFALLFGAHLVVIAVLALWKGVPAVQKSLRDHQASNPDSKDASLGPALAMAAILAAGAGVLALIWLRVLLAHAESMIRIALWANVAFTVVFALATFAASPFASVLFLALAAVNVCYIYAVRDRIGFASANLKAACAAVQDHGALFVVAIVLLVHQIAWLVLWTLSAIGVNQLFLDANPSCKDNFDVSQGRGQLCGGGGAYVALFFLLISVYWGQQVLQNILTCSTAGVVATWWYQPQAKSVTFGAFYRSMTTSFGSICFGSLLVAILQAMRSMADMLKNQAREDENAALACLACIAECILSMLAGIMEYINRWAYVYVGIYGYDFRTSGKAVMDLFRNRGWTAVINDDLTSSALGFGALGVGVVTCCIGLLVAHFSPESWFAALGSEGASYAVLGGIGFIAGTSMAMILTQVVIASLHTIFVCFAEDPVAFSRNHPREYEALVEGWRKFHGDALVSAYGSAV